MTGLKRTISGTAQSWTVSTFWLAKLRKSVAVNEGALWHWFDGLPRIVDTVRQRTLGFLPLDLMVASQYRFSFSLKDVCLARRALTHASLSSGSLVRRYRRSSILACRLIARHSASNHGVVAPWRTTTWWTGTRLSRMLWSVSSYNLNSWSASMSL